MRNSTADSATDVAVIGAGPFGLSIAAHLAARGTRFRIFGRPMESWRSYMPEGMFLKSTGDASNLSDPRGELTLKRFCALQGEPYADWDWPVPVELFSEYGLWFQKQLVPQLETTLVERCVQDGDGFRLELETGGSLTVRRVVVCTGCRDAAYIPPELSHLPLDLVSHSSQHRSFDRFRGARVMVLGAGQSALESAALLKEAGASPILVARAEEIIWGIPEGERSFYQRIRYPRTPLGVGWRYRFFDHPARPFRHLPGPVRRTLVQKVLGPFGAWWLQDRVEGQLPVLTGWRVKSAEAQPKGVAVQLHNGYGTQRLEFDHVIAGTGFQLSPEAFPFLDPQLRAAIGWRYGAPKLSPRFESAVPGLFFAGVASAMTFGPIMRFVAGVHRTLPELAHWLTADVRESRTAPTLEAAGRVRAGSV